MSILGSDANLIISDPAILGAVAALGVSFTLAGVLKVYLLGKAVGRERLGPHQPAWPLLPPLGFGFVAWLGAQLIYGMWKATQTGGHTTSADFISNLTARDFAFLATVPPLAGFYRH